MKLGMGDEVWTKKEFSFQKSSYLLNKKNHKMNFDPLLSYKYVILFSKLERMSLTQPPPTFLLDVTHFTVFFFWTRPLLKGEWNW